LAGRRPVIPELALARIRHFCEDRVPSQFRDEVRIDFDTRGRSITIFECRPPWDGTSGEWTRMRIAQIRYDDEAGQYSLHWADRNGRWHPYSRVRPTRHIETILREIDDDPTCIYWV
jgi:hypothetical protein